MRMFRLLTPLGWMAVAAGVLGVGLLLLGGLGFRWDPFNQTQRRLETAQAQAEVGRLEAEARRLESAAAVQQARRLDQFHQQQTATGRATAAVVEQARSADDAEIPLDAHRAERLRGHDRELCRLAPDLDGCASAIGPAGSREAALRPGGPAV
ncbi:hypothetical protein [Brevundimonas sp.]|uniref:hypothetical protein n=1 Tax=Brevundimonas sp. TaxID=1871086 RepID=UPI0025BD753F|nr:hypothetical protein [Brevundimonas sp.]